MCPCAELMEYALCGSTRSKDSTFSYYSSMNKCMGLKVQIRRSLVRGRMLTVLSSIPLPDAFSARLLILLYPLLLRYSKLLFLALNFLWKQLFRSFYLEI